MRTCSPVEYLEYFPQVNSTVLTIFLVLFPEGALIYYKFNFSYR